MLTLNINGGLLLILNIFIIVTNLNYLTLLPPADFEHVNEHQELAL